MRQLGRLTPCRARVVVFIRLTPLPHSPHLSSIVSNFSSTLMYSLVETGNWKMVSILPINAKQQTNLSLSTNISNHNLVNQSQSYNMLSSVSVPWSILWNWWTGVSDWLKSTIQIPEGLSLPSYRDFYSSNMNTFTFFGDGGVTN